MTKNSIVSGSLVFALLLAGCGGGGDDSPPPYDYAQHDGAYRCIDSETYFAITLSAKFTSSKAVFTGTGDFAGMTFEYADKVGLILGQPYYSNTLDLTSNSETVYFYNGALRVVTTPTVDVPNQLAQRPSNVMYCTKTA